MNPPDPQRTSYSLLGETLPVRTSEDPDLAERAYERVRERVEALRDRTQEPSRLQTALLVGLNLAGDLLRLEEKMEETGLSDETLQRLRSVRRNVQRHLRGE